MLYASFAKYGSIYKVLFMTTLLTGMTSAFLVYGITVLGKSEVFVILNTEMNLTTFIHACVIWFIADMLVIYKISKNYRRYINVNSAPINISPQE